VKSLRMATFRGRPWRADRAANGDSLCSLAAASLRENAERGAELLCVSDFAASFEEVP
jgi:hypothetical protein